MLRLQWLDADPSGTHRAGIHALLSDLPVEICTSLEASPTTHGIVLIDFAASDRIVANAVEAQRARGRPVVTLRPSSRTRPADLLITALDGLVSQLDDELDSTPFDEALLVLLRSRAEVEPGRYSEWLIRALVNAAIAQIFHDETARAVDFLIEASQLGDAPTELDAETREALLEALLSDSRGPPLERIKGLQGWLLLSSDS